MAMQKALREKGVLLMSYIHTTFPAIKVFIPISTGAQWLNTAGIGIDMDFPMFSGHRGFKGAIGEKGTFLKKDYQARVKSAKDDVARLLRGIGYIRGEIERIDKILPSLIKTAQVTGGGDDIIKTLKNKKTLLAVRLLRLRLMGRLIDTTIALEITSGIPLLKTYGP